MIKTNDNYFKDMLHLNDACLAPLAGVTDMPFRRICLAYNVGLMTCEMVSAKGLYYNNTATKDLLALDPNEKNTGVQIFGSDTVSIREAIKRYLNNSDFTFIDINMGCPVRKIISNGDGSALLSDQKKVATVANAVVEASEKPVSAKIRIGIDEDHINCLETVKTLEDCGVQAIAIHGRTQNQMYAGKANWDIIAEAVQISSIPIIANGDVTSVEQYVAIKKATKCNGVMIGRASMGNPFIFEQIERYNQTGKYMETNPISKLDVALRHFTYLLDFKDEHIACAEFRKHLAWYTKGMPNSAKMRNEINAVTSKEAMIALIDEIKKQIQ